MNGTYGSSALAHDTDDGVPRELGYDGADAPLRPRTFAGMSSSRGIQAWMLVLPADAVALLIPALWSPRYLLALAAMAALSLVLLSGGGRYRAKLHLSVLDELPTVVGRLLTAAAVVAAVFALRHDGVGVTGFLAAALAGIGLVVGGRVVTTAIILTARRRSGRDGPTFECLKFRSMTPATAAESAQQWNIAQDSRVGPVGTVLRRTSLDELPQLWNILRGDTPISDRARFDNYYIYIENRSLRLDAKVILRTVSEVLFARGR